MGAIRVEGVGKAYKQYPTRWSRMLEWALPFAPPRHRLTWVLQDVTFALAPGEAVGIVGNNGAGKSTLLKIITGTSQPTTGSVAIAGSVAALLELGMGFHPEFTGRQNVFMAAQLLGLAVEEIESLMPRIEAFAEIGEYIDRPVRIYSSGMMVRLAFSVATARRPDVLIVDEALSVGDAYFQHKSFDRIRELRAQGTTLLIVSHDRAAIQSICDRAILLDGGRVAKQGTPEEIMDFYNALLAEQERRTVRQQEVGGRVGTTSGTGEATVVEIALRSADGEQREIIGVGDSVTLDIAVDVHAELPELVLGYVIKDRLGQQVYGTNTHHLRQTLKAVRAGEKIRFRFDFPANLGEGTYSIAVALHTGDTHLARNYEWRDLALVFRVNARDVGKFVGVAWLPPRLEILR
jgi:homopolymeric O-antigen transport system ATP-binding protein